MFVSPFKERKKYFMDFYSKIPEFREIRDLEIFYKIVNNQNDLFSVRAFSLNFSNFIKSYNVKIYFSAYTTQNTEVSFYSHLANSLFCM